MADQVLNCSYFE